MSATDKQANLAAYKEAIDSMSETAMTSIKRHGLKPRVCLKKEYGLALEGGGARGAYHVGAWKALRDTGIKIKGVAGTSVGALIGALVVKDAMEEAIHIWSNISYSRIMEMDDEIMEKLFQGNISFREMAPVLWDKLSKGGIGLSPLRQWIEEILDEDKVRNANKDFFLVTYSLSDMKGLKLGLDDIPYGQLNDFLMASAYLFGFKNEKLHGKHYLDGSIVDNLPSEILIDAGYKDIFKVHLLGIRKPAEPKYIDSPYEEDCDDTVNEYDIIPRIKLGNIIKFDKEKGIKNITAGYFDGLRMIYGLEGLVYYIWQDYEHEWYAEKLEGLSIKRRTEITLKLKISIASNDKELYMAMLEACAIQLKVQKYNIYTASELIETVDKRYQVFQKKETSCEMEMPVFIQEFCQDYIIGKHDESVL